ncbi:hypothetical protein [Paenibacillus nasutitermitis]|uniref:DUF2264 domain-containing protein n=1 Tax=Paenibacillus nasutitermitis TaxID=1652958 RepID=A0A916YNG5_9BACL|nr:hypothetical protein [Paenibacillus nasutitermitis]GGD53493.1 hypothetical protein GCM10010911_08820 [Paenibacillus nasutitermitis]
MFTLERQSTHQQMQSVLLDYMKTVSAWIDKETGAIEDRWDTIYSENYTAGTAAVIFAGGAGFSGNTELQDTAIRLIRRSIVRLKDMNAAPFTRMFIYHFSMMALLILPEDVRSRHKEEFAEDFLHGEPQDCGTINLNCAALQLGNELFLEKLGYRLANKAFMADLMALIEERENEGFLNDSFDQHDQETFREHDGMPISYSAFIMFILTGVMSAIEEWTPEQLEIRARLQLLIEKGQAWLNHATSFDGTFAMMERSRHQMFTWGSFVAYQAYAGMGDKGLFDKAFQAWLPYKKEDGTYSMTPNYLPHELRVGYEWYTLVNCYGILGMTGISMAERIIRSDLQMERINDRPPLPVNNQYLDLRSGYAFVRSGDDFFACSLRMHVGKYSPALCGFHYRLGGTKPPLAEPKLNPANLAPGLYQQGYDLGAWEGFLLRDVEGTLYYPDMTVNPETEWLEKGIAMTGQNEFLKYRKTIALTGTGIEWTYRLKAKRDFVSCEHILPLLLTDGRDGTRIEKRTEHGWMLSYAGRRYEISCDACDNTIRTPDAVYANENNLSLSRSLRSVSGVSANLSLVVAGPRQAGDEWTWTTRLVELK